MIKKKAGQACGLTQKTELNSCNSVADPAGYSSGFTADILFVAAILAHARPQASPSLKTVAFVTPENLDRLEQDCPPYSEPFFDPPKTAWFDGQPVKRRRPRRKGDR